LFGLIACAVVFLLSARKHRIVGILGLVLTPVLLVSLFVVIISGLWHHPEAMASSLTTKQAFGLGLREGYNTLDLLAAFFFSTVVLGSIKARFPRLEGESEGGHRKRILWAMLRSTLIGATLLGVIYGGLGLVASYYGVDMSHVAPDQLLGSLAFYLLGPAAGLVSNIAVALACLTTAITLSAVFATVISRDVFGGKIGYLPALSGTLIVSYAISYLKVTGIVKLIAPVVVVCYPALIALALLNLWYKLRNFQPVRLPIAAVFGITLIYAFV
jgi:branched-chain amino acid:cation transporter, LIVCS family